MNYKSKNDQFSRYKISKIKSDKIFTKCDCTEGSLFVVYFFRFAFQETLRPKIFCEPETIHLKKQICFEYDNNTIWKMMIESLLPLMVDHYQLLHSK